MRDIFGAIVILVVGVLIIGIFIGFVTCGVQYFHVIFVDNVPSIVKVNGQVVYEGSSAGFETGSEGANTSVTVKGGFLYMFPKAYYVSKNVEVIGVKK